MCWSDNFFFISWHYIADLCTLWVFIELVPFPVKNIFMMVVSLNHVIKALRKVLIFSLMI